MAMEKVRMNKICGIIIIVIVHGHICIIVPQQLVEQQIIKQDLGSMGSFDEFL